MARRASETGAAAPMSSPIWAGVAAMQLKKAAGVYRLTKQLVKAVGTL